ncbi:MAG: nucleotidyltransferase domain-containing protein [Promethearchaeota archaeon]
MNKHERRDFSIPKSSSWSSRANYFLLKIKDVLSRELETKDFAIFTFGSMNTNDHATTMNGTSDVDVLIVLKEKLPPSKIQNIWKKLNTLENIVFYQDKKKGIINKILRVIERQTGMHENIFLSTIQSVKKANFSKIFRTNKILSKLIAPRIIVIGSCLSHVRFIHGNESFSRELENLKIEINTRKHLSLDLIKSLVMNIALSIGGIILLPFTKYASLYTIESIKWSLYASFYALTHTRPPKRMIKFYFEKMGINPRFLNKWIELSKNYRTHVKFTLIAPIHVIEIHVIGLRLKRIKK